MHEQHGIAERRIHRRSALLHSLSLQYGLVDVPQKRSLYRPPAWMSGGTAAPPPARSVPSAARAAGRTAQPPSPALPPTPTRRTAREGPEPAGGSTRAAGHNSSGGSAHRPAQPDGQLHPGSPAGFPFAWLVPSPNDPPQLRLFPGQLRATSSKRLGTAGGALLIQPTDSSSSRASSHGSEHMVAERSDSAAFGSEISFKGDD